jgi:putative two-component system response regulator
MKPTILVVEDDQELRETLGEQLRALGYDVVVAASADAAFAMLETTAPDLVLSDVDLGATNGVELCARVKKDPRFQFTPLVLMTGMADRDARVAGLAAGADDFFVKPVDFLELRTRLGALLHVKTVVDQLERAETLITTLSLTVEARDPYTGGHCERLARHAVALGEALDLDEATQKALRVGGFLHDLGKIAVPDAILLKPGPLDLHERRKMEKHPVIGALLVHGIKTMDAVRPIIRHHHERFDGSGYPDGLKGDAIPLGARIMAVADVYDALRTARPYKDSMTQETAIAALLEETDRGWWDPKVATTFVTIIRDLNA